MIKNKYLLLATSIMGCIATMPVCATECVVGDCASLGYSQGDVPNCKKYVSCPFDTSYKTCVEYDYPYVPCPVGYNTSVTEETCAKSQKLKTTTGLNGVTCGACECKYTTYDDCESDLAVEAGCQEDKYGCYYPPYCPTGWYRLLGENVDLSENEEEDFIGTKCDNYIWHPLGDDRISCPKGLHAYHWVVPENEAYCEYAENQGMSQHVENSCFQFFYMDEECDDDGENCKSVKKKDSCSIQSIYCVKCLE